MKTYQYTFILFFFLPGAFSLPEKAYARNDPSWVAPKSADQRPGLLKDNETSTKAGKKIYIQYCFVCHGNTGKGDGLAGMSLNPRPSGLTSAPVQKQSDRLLFENKLEYDG